MATLRTIKKQLMADAIAGNASIVKGPPGYGKTDLMEILARWWFDYVRKIKPTARVGFGCFFMATQTPIGFTGLPWKGTRTWGNRTYTVTDPAIPQWFMVKCMETGEILPANMFDTVFLVIEEWGQGSLETKRAGAEVLRAGGTPPFYLPCSEFPSPRVALTNVDASDGVTKEFDFIIGRRAERTVTGDVDVFIEDFADHPYKWMGRTWMVSPETKTWAKQDGGAILFEPKPKVQGPWCNPRSLTMADRYKQTITELNNGVVPLDDPSFQEGLQGYIGMGAAAAYISTLRFALELPSIEQVVADPLGTPVPAKADRQMLMSYMLAGRVQRDQLANVITYMTKKDKNGRSEMPQDMAVTFISALLRRDYAGMMNEDAMQAWIARNAQMVSIVAALSAK